MKAKINKKVSVSVTLEKEELEVLRLLLNHINFSSCNKDTVGFLDELQDTIDTALEFEPNADDYGRIAFYEDGFGSQGIVIDGDS